jgi:hypothetical protein
MVVNILQQARTPDGQGLVNGFQVTAQLIRQPGGHFPIEKGPGNPVVPKIGHD